MRWALNNIECYISYLCRKLYLSYKNIVGETEFLKDCIDYTTYLRSITTHILKINTCVILMWTVFLSMPILQYDVDSIYYCAKISIGLKENFPLSHKKIVAPISILCVHLLLTMTSLIMISLERKAMYASQS